MTFREARSIVTRQFAYLAAIPTAYIKAVAEHERHHGSGVLLSPSVNKIMITRISAEEAMSPNFGRENIIHCLLHNRIPVVWLTHAYPYGVQYVHQHLTAGGNYHGEYLAVDQEQVHRLQEEPVAYPPFDGWYHPTSMDLIQLCHLMHVKER